MIEGLYLHENYFTPDHNIYKELKLNEEEEFVLIRFVSWNAHHDFGQSGLDLEKFKQSMKFVAPVAKAAGVSIEETTGFLATLADSGITKPFFLLYCF